MAVVSFYSPLIFHASLPFHQWKDARSSEILLTDSVQHTAYCFLPGNYCSRSRSLSSACEKLHKSSTSVQYISLPLKAQFVQTAFYYLSIVSPGKKKAHTKYAELARSPWKGGRVTPTLSRKGSISNKGKLRQWIWKASIKSFIWLGSGCSS